MNKVKILKERIGGIKIGRVFGVVSKEILNVLVKGSFLLAALAFAGGIAICQDQQASFKTVNGTTRPNSSDKSDWSRSNLDKVIAPVFINKMAEFYVAGAAISIVKDGQLRYARGFGYSDVFAQKRVKADKTIFRIGSVTKTMTGAALLQLVDRGKVNLDADVKTYLTNVRIENDYSKAVKVKHLLTHTGGFDQFGYGRHVSRREDEISLEKFLKSDLKTIRQPGGLSCYDTYGITLAGHLVEKLSGLSYEEYLTKHIFDPLGMYRSNIYPHKALKSDVAVGYGFTGTWNREGWEFMNTAPASTVNSTVTDMSQYMIMLLNDGELNGKRILSKKVARSMLIRQQTNDPRLPGYGYTFWEDHKYGVTAFSHGGSMSGFGSLIFLIPEENFGVFIAYNQESSRLANVVVKTLVDKFFAHRKFKREARPEIKIDVSRYTGNYANNLYNHSRPDRGGWQMRTTNVVAGENPGQMKFLGVTWTAIEPLVFQRKGGEPLVFREDRNGKVTHMLWRQNVYEKLSEKDIAAYKEASKPKPVAIEQSVLERYAGRYKTSEGVVGVRSGKGFLEIEIPGRGVQKLLASSNTTFFSPERPVRLVFQVDSSGKIIRSALRAGNAFIQLVKIEDPK